MDINNFLGIAIVGSALSLLMQWAKAHLGGYPLGNKLVIVAASLVVGSAYYFLQDTAYWQTVLGVLASASTFYAFFLKKSE